MDNFSIYLLTVIISYFIGSFPSAIIISKIFNLSDPRTYGSGNPGATNVLRSGNKTAAIVTLILDATKGFLAVLICKTIFNNLAGVGAISALFAVCGHIFSLWLKFKGGKGVATAVGALLAYAPLIAMSVMCVFIILMILFRYVSLGSIAGAIMACVFLFFGKDWGLIDFFPNNIDFICIILMVVLVITRHHQNIGRILNGTESKFGKSS